jgi:hypothetical protein
MSADDFATEARKAILGLAGSMTAADDQAQAMTPDELADRLLTGRWSTIEVHEAGLRLRSLAAALARAEQERDEWKNRCITFWAIEVDLAAAAAVGREETVEVGS